MPFTLEKKDFFIAEEGLSVVRILPVMRQGKAMTHFYEAVRTHYEVTPQCRALICCQSRDVVCPVETYCERLKRSERPENWDRAARLRAVERYMVNVVVVETRAVKIWSLGERVLQDVLTLIVDQGYGKLTDPDLGNNVLVDRRGQGVSTRYTLRVEEPASRCVLTKPQWQRQMYDLHRCFAPPSVAEVEEILRGVPPVV